MFSRWGAFVYRFRKPILLLTVLIALASTTLATKASGELSSGGWFDPTAESSKVADRLAEEFGSVKSSLIVLFRSATEEDATSPAFQAALAETLKGLQGDARVAGVIGYAQTGDSRFISTKGDAAYALVQLTLTDKQSAEVVEDLTAKIVPATGMTADITGSGPLTRDIAVSSEKDVQRAETVSLPIAAIILVIVFASLIAAGMPLLVAGMSIPTTLALVYLVAQWTEMSVYVLNIATMMGLALAIDYSLFVVSRFQEELKRGRTVEQAVERAVGTAGKAITFSGFAVAIGLSGLLWFSASALRSIGIAGSLTVLVSVFYGLTFLPAVLGVLGHRVNSLSVAGLVRRFRGSEPEVARASRWEGVAHAVMARPWAVLVPVVIGLGIAGSPFLHLEQGVPDAASLPAGLPSRDAYMALRSEFPAGETNPLVVVVDLAKPATDPESIRAVVALSERIDAVEGIDRVEGPFVIRDPASGQPLTTDQVVALYQLPATVRPPGVTKLLETYVRGTTVRLNAISPLPPARAAGTAIVPLVRGVERPAGVSNVTVGGAAAAAHDFLVAQNERMPFAIGTTLLVSALVLFLLFGSITIPIKAVMVTLLSISASFGALVWIFQDGNLANLLDFETLGYTTAGNPIIMFSVLFGLSMDYEVLLLSRIQEAHRRTGDNTASVAEGLALTASVITGAALIMVTVFAGFALAQAITIKSFAVGMAIAVLVDATIVRVLLVPATMRLLGDWNWWAPGPLRRIADRFKFSHVEDDDPSGPNATLPASWVTP